jgi:hypothetical protein
VIACEQLRERRTHRHATFEQLRAAAKNLAFTRWVYGGDFTFLFGEGLGVHEFLPFSYAAVLEIHPNLVSSLPD